MEMETIKKDAKKSIVELLNKSLQVEYDFLFGYPRVIDKLVNIDKIHDEQLIENIELVVKESLRHFDEIDKLIAQLGGETMWHIDVVGWSVDVEGMLLQLQDKENWVISWYEAVKRVAEQNKVKVGGLFGRLARSPGGLPEDVVNVNDIISLCERHIIDEEKHIRLCKDSVDRLSMLKNK